MRISPKLVYVKNDFVDELDRGTVAYTTEKRNYCFHKVEIPDATVLEYCNFRQAKPETDSIKGENLVFRYCDLKNVTIHPSWILDCCLALHEKIKVKKEEVVDGVKIFTIEQKIKKKGEHSYTTQPDFLMEVDVNSEKQIKDIELKQKAV